ncbi:helicase-associated domain-containing protein [Dermabacter sp. HMSC08H10]|uniref:helicase-associated domain-containing protein n=1 Tax=Dermabacter sp. HMSC08H10 TaxID=1581144 RepID=UPI0008A15C1C|nr:helicase-associated domain-containing protein [Dermabacter sp. HMSC08H10]OFT20193.1 hypothetical protein HMPREF3176_08130 [Dermabacter sp. HMSC08H10]
MARTLADALREFDDARLIELLNARRDLTSPIPLGIAPLAARATQPGSVHRALGSLVLPELQLAEVFAAYAGPVSPEQLARAVSTSTEQIAPHVYRLATLGLVFTDDSGRSLVPVRALAEALPHPAGLAPRLSSDPSPDEARTIVEDLPDSLREVAHSLTFAPARLTGSPTSSLAKQLSSARLITKVNGTDGPRLLIPRTVHLALRDGIVHRTFAHAPTPGPEAAPERFEGARDAQAIEAALEASRIAHTISTWHADPPSVLKRGGIPLRDARRLAAAAGTSHETWTSVIHAAWVGGLIGNDGETWQVTREYGEFSDASPARRWADLCSAYVRSNYLGALAGTRFGEVGLDGFAQGEPRTGETPRAALSASVGRKGVKVRRRHMLRHLADYPEREASAASLAESLAWAFPTVQRAALIEEAYAFTREAEAFGLIVDGVPSVLAPAALESLSLEEVAALDVLEAALDEKLPEPVDHILLDADLTVTVPGLPSARVAAVLEWTEVTSRGAGVVARVTSESIARALSAGGSADVLMEELAALSLTGVPDVLAYLVRDEARKRGQVTVGPATSFIMGEEEHLDRLMDSSEALRLGLKRLAPTVVISSGDPGFVMGSARAAGLAPLAAGGRGAAVDERTLGSVRGGPVGLELEADGREQVLDVEPSEAVARIRAADSGRLEEVSVPQRLLAAIAEEREVQIGIVDGRGGTRVLQVEPLALEGGRLRARDGESGEEFTVLIHRVLLP